MTAFLTFFETRFVKDLNRMDWGNQEINTLFPLYRFVLFMTDDYPIALMFIIVRTLYYALVRCVVRFVHS